MSQLPSGLSTATTVTTRAPITTTTTRSTSTQAPTTSSTSTQSTTSTSRSTSTTAPTTTTIEVTTTQSSPSTTSHSTSQNTAPTTTRTTSTPAIPETTSQSLGSTTQTTGTSTSVQTPTESSSVASTSEIWEHSSAFMTTTTVEPTEGTSHSSLNTTTNQSVSSTTESWDSDTTSTGFPTTPTPTTFEVTTTATIIEQSTSASQGSTTVDHTTTQPADIFSSTAQWNNISHTDTTTSVTQSFFDVVAFKLQITGRTLEIIDKALQLESVTNSTRHGLQKLASDSLQKLDSTKSVVVPTERELEPFIQPFIQTRLATAVRSVYLKNPQDMLTLNFAYCASAKIANTSDDIGTEFHYDVSKNSNHGIQICSNRNAIRDNWINANIGMNASQQVLLEVGASYQPKFASFDFDPVLGTRSERIVTNITVSGMVPDTVRNIEKIVIIEINLKNLYKSNERFKKYVGAKLHSCVFVKFFPESNAMNAPPAVWSDEGCYHVKTFINGDGELISQCACDHLTNIGGLVDLCGSDPVLDFDSMAQKHLSSVLGGMTVICSIIVAVHILFRSHYSKQFLIPPIFIRLNLAFSLALAHIALIIGQYLPYTDGHENACLSVAILSHWILLVSFAWMAVECFRIVSYRMNMHIKRYSRMQNAPWNSVDTDVLCFRFPDIDGRYGTVYGSDDQWCWIHPQSFVFLMVTFVMPILLILAFNMGALIFHYHKECHRHKNQKSHTHMISKAGQGPYKILQEFANTVIMLLFLGFGWLFGFLVHAVCLDDSTKEIICYFFILVNGSQGLYLLVFYFRTQGVFRTVKRHGRKISDFRSQSSRFLGSLRY
ncbi:uncharacterized protein LOC129583469 [Paramacrobiotus metropolitanus]|uniref:uncharacterized protein LOC129583469 n=1 Tax=Paramacrobiotus metropolitanus TaxID=2943436 RepID=UPI0024461471|nr:uncharacterized protein LOC129583469 [Paramacrobiotus metropolitanus]